jgi:hypothetical protein
MSSKNQPSTQTTTAVQQVPPYISAAQENLVNAAQRVTGPFMAEAPTNIAAGFTPDQTWGFDLTRGLAQETMTGGFAPTAVDYSKLQYDPAQMAAYSMGPATHMNAASMQSAQVPPSAISQMQAAWMPTSQVDTSNVAQMTPAAMQAASMQAASMQAAQMEKAAQMQAAQLKPGEIAPFMNPYTQEVVNRTASTLEDSNARSLAAIRAQQAAAGAFGGSRGALQEAEQYRNMGDTLANTTAGLNKAGWDSAAGLASTNTGYRQAANATNAGFEQQTGMLNANLNQQANMTNSGYQQAANAANAGWQQQSNLTNSGYQQQAGMYNAGAMNAADLANAQLANQAALANAGFTQNANQYNSGALNTNLANNANLYQQGNLANAGWLQNANQFNATGDNASAQFNTAALNAAAQANMNASNLASSQGMTSYLGGLNMEGQNQTADYNRQVAAIQSLLGIGGQNQSLAQQSVGAPFTALQSLIGGTPYSNTGGVTNTIQPLNKPSGLQQALPYAMLGSTLLSDEREKTDVKKIGKDPKTGVEMAAYRYKGDPKTYPKVTGPASAQQMERVMPGSTQQVGKRRGVKPSALRAVMGV